MLYLPSGETLLEQVSPESEERVKKLVSVFATSTPVTGTKEETVGTAEAIETAEVGKKGKESEGEYPNLVQVQYIRYPITFWKKSVSVLTFFDSGSKVNAIYLIFARELGLPIRPTNVGAQKIDGTMRDNFEIIVTAFSMTNKANRVRFFEKTFIKVNVGPEVVFGMLFLILSGADIDILGQELRWRTYITKKALPTTRHVELVGRKEFAALVLDPKHETYIVHVGSVSSDALLDSSPLNVHSFRRSQISGLIVEEASTKVPAKYLNFADIFSPDLMSELPEYIRINDHAIKLVDCCQQPPYEPIYSLGPVELGILKVYIETNLGNEFIRPSKSPAGASILFDQKLDGSLRLYVDYQGLNNLTITNWYLLPLIGELLDRLGRAKQFTQLDFINSYHQMRICKGNKWKTVFRT